MADFDYGKAEADLDDAGCPHPEETYDYKTEKGFSSYIKENGLNPEKYRNNSGIGYGTSGTEGCYITTACVAARGLPDDCEDLETLRSFRDSYIKKQPDGVREIAEYYNEAPKVVRAINSMPDSREIWERVYSQMVAPCVQMIREERFDEAYMLYKKYSEELAEKYAASGNSPANVRTRGDSIKAASGGSIRTDGFYYETGKASKIRVMKFYENGTVYRRILENMRQIDTDPEGCNAVLEYYCSKRYAHDKYELHGENKVFVNATNGYYVIEKFKTYIIGESGNTLVEDSILARTFHFIKIKQ